MSLNVYSLEDLELALETNADFEEVASLSKAKAFITAANRWLIRRPDSASDGSSSLSIGKQFIMELLKRAQTYVAENGTATDGSSSSVRFLSVMQGFR